MKNFGIMMAILTIALIGCSKDGEPSNDYAKPDWPPKENTNTGTGESGNNNSSQGIKVDFSYRYFDSFYSKYSKQYCMAPLINWSVSESEWERTKDHIDTIYLAIRCLECNEFSIGTKEYMVDYTNIRGARWLTYVFYPSEYLRYEYTPCVISKSRIDTYSFEMFFYYYDSKLGKYVYPDPNTYTKFTLSYKHREVG